MDESSVGICWDDFPFPTEWDNKIPWFETTTNQPKTGWLVGFTMIVIPNQLGFPREIPQQSTMVFVADGSSVSEVRRGYPQFSSM